MTVVIPYVKNPTWADGSGGGTSIDAADLNKVEDGIFDAHNMPCVRAFHSANQSIANGSVWAALNFDSESYDTDTMHDNATNNTRLTCKHVGVYSIKGCMAFAGNSTGTIREARIITSAGTVIDWTRAAPNAVSNFLRVNADWKMAVNDWVNFEVAHDATAAVNSSFLTGNSPTFSMVRVATG